MSISKKLLIKIVSFVALASVLFLLQFYLDFASYFNPDNIKKWLSDAGPWAPLVYLSVMALAVVISPIPSLPLDIAAGAFFGAFYGTLYSVIGATGGAIISFIIARFLGRELIERFLTGHINFCNKCSDKLLTKIVFFSRLLPFLSFDLISYGAGLTNMSLKKFSIATFFGMIPLTFVYNYFGSVMIIGKGVTLISGLLMVILFFLIPRWIEKNNLFSLKKIFQH